MILLARSDDSRLSRWWWTVDRWLLLAVTLLITLGILMTFSAGVSVAGKLDLPGFHFAKRQMVFAVAAFGLMIGVSLLEARAIRRLCLGLYLLAAALIILVLIVGPEIKGANRWLQLGSFTLQPSEFLKPAMIVLTAWLMAEQLKTPEFPGRKAAAGLLGVSLVLLALQPDYGQAMMLTSVWIGQIFIAGLPLGWLAAAVGAGAAFALTAYFAVPHVAQRIDAFLMPGSADTFQIDRALSAMQAGGIFGRGPGEGTVKQILPDSHTDFVYAVAGEEFGVIACLALLAIFAVIVTRGLARLLEEEDLFVILASGGLLALFGLQAFVNIGVNLAVLPSTGMTLPFISYGGSSLLSLALAMGIVLALTRDYRRRTAPRHRRRLKR